ncbi:MAG: hypothetical protein NTY87_08130 [Planctomycetia bacterium]|nr:hypothetical protein [Planctomycetia bacterium]
MLSRKPRHLIAQRKIAQRWNYVVLNRSLNSEVNGEYWLISLLPPKSLVIDVGSNRGEFSANVI